MSKKECGDQNITPTAGTPDNLYSEVGGNTNIKGEDIIYEDMSQNEIVAHYVCDNISHDRTDGPAVFEAVAQNQKDVIDQNAISQNEMDAPLVYEVMPQVKNDMLVACDGMPKGRKDEPIIYEDVTPLER